MIWLRAEGGIKMIIPKKTKIASHIFKIICPHNFQERDDIFGRIDFAVDKIFISVVDSGGNPCSEAHTTAVYLHELFHGIDRIYCGNKLGEDVPKEELIEGLAQGLAQVLGDNFEPLKPKRIK